ncbi:MAG: hypothetical protein AAF682_11870 [Planctomycetota bacterium]
MQAHTPKALSIGTWITLAAATAAQSGLEEAQFFADPVFGSSPGDSLGQVVGVADMDGDGNDDRLYTIGGRDQVVLEGLHDLLPFLADGSTPALDGSNGFGAAFDVGDLNGDGHQDVVVGAPAMSFGRGAVFQFLGPNFDEVEAQVFRQGFLFDGGTPAVGSAIAILDDLDGDGWRDYAVGAPEWTPQPVTGSLGMVLLFSGQTAAPFGPGVIQSQVPPVGAANIWRWGRRLVAGSFNGGGVVNDLAIGYYKNAAAQNQVTVWGGPFFGPTSSVCSGFRADEFANAGPVGAPGGPDGLAWTWDDPPAALQREAGVARWTSGSVCDQLTNGQLTGGTASGLGVAVSSVGDLDGDGLHEFVTTGVDGAIRITTGGCIPDLDTPPCLPNPASLAHMLWDTAEGQISSLAFGDLDNDGWNEIVAGIPTDGASAGKVVTIGLGRTDPPDPTRLSRLSVLANRVLQTDDSAPVMVNSESTLLTFFVDAGTAAAGDACVILANQTPTDWPGIMDDASVYPLAFDPLWSLNSSVSGLKLFVHNNTGAVDANGHFVGRGRVLPGILAPFVGLTFYFGASLIDADNGWHVQASNRVAVQLVP